MHKNIGAAIIRQDEAKPAICVEELHPASWHFLVAFHPIAPPPREFFAVVRDLTHDFGSASCLHRGQSCIDLGLGRPSQRL
jgi:hypothetical protein